VAVGVWLQEAAARLQGRAHIKVRVYYLLLCQNTTRLMAFIAFLNDSAVASAPELDGFDSAVD
jgi:hypothetical protein